MQQTEIQKDQSVCHARTRTDKTIFGLAFYESTEDKQAIVRESLDYFRFMTLMKNYNYEGPCDKVLIYLWVVTAHFLRETEKVDDQATAEKTFKRISEEAAPRKDDKKNFLGGLLVDDGVSFDKYNKYLQSLKQILGQQIIERLYEGGKKRFEAKFWTGLSKKKFMGLTY